MLTQEEVFECISYEIETGIFRTKKKTTRREPGDIIGTYYKNGYQKCYVNGHPVYGHRLAWFYVFGVWPSSDEEIDHINGDRSDNRLSNLRLVTSRGNQCNRVEHRNGSRLPGAHPFKWSKTNPWRAKASIDGIKTHIGLYPTELEAHLAYCAATGITPNKTTENPLDKKSD